jgi:hypothetical protein
MSSKIYNDDIYKPSIKEDYRVGFIFSTKAITCTMEYKKQYKQYHLISSIDEGNTFLNTRFYFQRF